MTALESEEVSGLSGTDGSELELLPSDGRDDEESVSDDGSGTVIVLSEEADDEFSDGFNIILGLYIVINKCVNKL